jgi:hypothetical protein
MLLALLCMCAGEARRAEALAAILARQQEAAANVREAAERRRLAEAERLAQLEHRQRRKEEVQVGCADMCDCVHVCAFMHAAVCCTQSDAALTHCQPT